MYRYNGCPDRDTSWPHRSINESGQTILTWGDNKKYIPVYWKIEYKRVDSLACQRMSV